MSDPLQEIFVTGDRPENYLNWAAQLDRYYPSQGSPAAGVTPPQDAFAPPLPVVTVVAPKIPLITRLGGSLLGALTTILFDKPSDYGLEWPGTTPPGGGAPPPAADDPLMPPNWEDISKPRPDVDYGDDKTLPGLPFPNYPPAGPDVDLPLDNIDVVANPFEGLTELPHVPGPIDLPFYNYPGVGSEPSPLSPLGEPGVDPIPDVFTAPGTTPRPATPGQPAPDLLDVPFDDPFPDAWADPSSPSPFDAPPRGAPVTPPGDFFTPSDPLDPFLTPDLGDDSRTPTPPSDAGGCGCPKKPKKKKKKSDPRSVCWKGTYIQRARGVSYYKREKVPCEGSSVMPSSVRKSLLSPVLSAMPGEMNNWDFWGATATQLAKKASKMVRAKKKRDARAAAAARRKAAAAKHRDLDKKRAARAKARLAKAREQTAKARAATKAARARKKSPTKKGK